MFLCRRVKAFRSLENEIPANGRWSWFNSSSDSKNLLDERVQLACGADLHEGLESVAFHLETCFQYGADCLLPLFRHSSDPSYHLTVDGGLSGYREPGSYRVMVRS